VVEAPVEGVDVRAVQERAGEAHLVLARHERQHGLDVAAPGLVVVGERHAVERRRVGGERQGRRKVGRGVQVGLAEHEHPVGRAGALHHAAERLRDHLPARAGVRAGEQAVLRRDRGSDPAERPDAARAGVARLARELLDHLDVVRADRNREIRVAPLLGAGEVALQRELCCDVRARAGLALAVPDLVGLAVEHLDLDVDRLGRNL
jgi:hypothetical protein